MRLNTSLPMLSAPNQWSADGPWRLTPRKVVVGSFSGSRSLLSVAESSSRPRFQVSMTTRTPPAIARVNQPPSRILTEHDASSSASRAMKMAVAPIAIHGGKPQP